MGAPLHAAIHDDVDLIADRVDDFRQLVKAAARAVKLTPAMVGHHDAGAADVDRPPGVLDGHDALETELTVPMPDRSEEHTSELQSLMRISYAVFCLKKKIKDNI